MTIAIHSLTFNETSSMSRMRKQHIKTWWSMSHDESWWVMMSHDESMASTGLGSFQNHDLNDRHLYQRLSSSAAQSGTYLRFSFAQKQLGRQISSVWLAFPSPECLTRPLEYSRKSGTIVITGDIPKSLWFSIFFPGVPIFRTTPQLFPRLWHVRAPARLHVGTYRWCGGWSCAQ